MKDEAIFLILFFVTVVFSWLAFPEPAPAPGLPMSRDDRCHDPRIEDKWRQVLDLAPDDLMVLESRALRLGLCQMLERGEISSQQVTEIWNAEPLEQTVSIRRF